MGNNDSKENVEGGSNTTILGGLLSLLQRTFQLDNNEKVYSSDESTNSTFYDYDEDDDESEESKESSVNSSSENDDNEAEEEVVKEISPPPVVVKGPAPKPKLPTLDDLNRETEAKFIKSVIDLPLHVDFPRLFPLITIVDMKNNIIWEERKSTDNLVPNMLEFLLILDKYLNGGKEDEIKKKIL